jgi:hypothetical protein
MLSASTAQLTYMIENHIRDQCTPSDMFPRTQIQFLINKLQHIIRR